MTEKAALPLRPAMPGALTALYLISSIAGAIALLVALSLAFSVGFPDAALPIGYIVGGVVGVFVPTLMTHAIVTAVEDLRGPFKS